MGQDEMKEKHLSLNIQELLNRLYRDHEILGFYTARNYDIENILNEIEKNKQILNLLLMKKNE